MFRGVGVASGIAGGGPRRATAEARARAEIAKLVDGFTSTLVKAETFSSSRGATPEAHLGRVARLDALREAMRAHADKEFDEAGPSPVQGH